MGTQGRIWVHRGKVGHMSIEGVYKEHRGMGRGILGHAE